MVSARSPRTESPGTRTGITRRPMRTITAPESTSRLIEAVEVVLDPAVVHPERLGREVGVTDHQTIDAERGRHAGDRRSRRAPGRPGAGWPRGRGRERSAWRTSSRSGPRRRHRPRGPASRRTPGPVGTDSAVTVPGDGRKFCAGSSATRRNSIACPRGSDVGLGDQPRTGRETELLGDQVDPGGLLGDGVLDLQPGVHLEEGDRSVGADQVLHRAGAAVAGRLADRAGRRVDAGPRRGGQERGRGLLDELLVAPLHRAVAGADDERPGRRRRRAPGPRRGGPPRGSARRSTRRGRRRRPTRGSRTRRQPGSPRGCAPPSVRGLHRRRRP